MTAGETAAQTTTHTFQAESDQPLSEAIIAAVATLSGSTLEDAAEEFEPLYYAIDPEALDTLFHTSDSMSRNFGRVSFQYADYEVTVDTNRQITIEQN